MPRNSKASRSGKSDSDALHGKLLQPQLSATKPDTRRKHRQAAAAGIESRFSKLNSQALENMNLIATYTPLRRPIQGDEVAVLRQDRVDGDGAGAAKGEGASGRRSSGEGEASEASEEEEAWTLPKKPRWRHDMDRKEVQSNEESVFTNWLAAIDERQSRRMQQSNNQRLFTGAIPVPQLPRPAPTSTLLPSLFERNVAVYRQLWRVMDRSQILLVLADCRCPLLHLPGSLVGYLRRFARRRVVVVLTKKDVVGEQVAGEWKEWLESRFKEEGLGWKVVATESYAKRERMEGQGSRTRTVPYLSAGSRKDLLKAIASVHAGLLTPPAAVQNDPARLKEWQPPCSADVDWASYIAAGGREDSDETSAAAASDEASHSNGATATASTSSSTSSSPVLTLGLIGQPNVGKSSLLNALLGRKVVHASRTPGKTKTFQTHRLPRAASPSSSAGGPSSSSSTVVELCDCPGLVFPSSAGQELQTMGAILPISQTQAILQAVRFVAEHMPLEDVLGLDLEDAKAAAAAEGDEESGHVTATTILEALCKRHGYRTAKAGRWDVNRAGNLLLRIVAEGRGGIRWAFRPPGSEEGLGSDGVWLRDEGKGGRGKGETSYLEEEEEDDEDEEEGNGGETRRRSDRPVRRVSFAEEVEGGLSDESDQEDEDNSDDEEKEGAAATGKARSLFAALAVEDGDESEDEEDEDEEEEGEGSAKE